jgi:hypothetical protein
MKLFECSYHFRAGAIFSWVPLKYRCCRSCRGQKCIGCWDLIKWGSCRVSPCRFGQLVLKCWHSQGWFVGPDVQKKVQKKGSAVLAWWSRHFCFVDHDGL